MHVVVIRDENEVPIRVDTLEEQEGNPGVLEAHFYNPMDFLTLINNQ